MSNKQCKLPDGSMRKQKKGYEEIFVPGLKPPAFQQNEKLIPVTEMPKWAQGAFAGMGFYFYLKKDKNNKSNAANVERRRRTGPAGS
jgi:hypothetical protein